MPLTVLFESPELQAGSPIDIVAVRNLFDVVTPPIDSWDWLPRLIRQETWQCRILLYDYNPDSLLDIGTSGDECLRSEADALLKDLLLYRRLEAESKRPLVFICHGFGGLIVKSALVRSGVVKEASAWCRSIFLSTYAVLFVSTPHLGISRSALEILSPYAAGPINQFAIALLYESTRVREPPDSSMLSDLHLQFRPLADSVLVFNYWELQDTHIGDMSALLVEKHSAAPTLEGSESYGLAAAHRDLLSFNDKTNQGTEHIWSVLKSCVSSAASSIQARWRSDPFLNQDSHLDALSPPEPEHGHNFQRNIITGGRTHFGDNITNNYIVNRNGHHRSDPGDGNPQESATQKAYKFSKRSCPRFTGRQLQLRLLQRAFADPSAVSGREGPRIAVIHGVSGSGKTQFCLKYAEQARHDYWDVFFIDASSKANAEARYSILGQEHGRGATFEAGKFWLYERTKPWLLILDNADDPDLGIADLIPDSAYGDVLITTRNRKVVDTFPQGFALQLRGMDPEDAVELLLKTADLPPQRQDRPTAKILATELRYLALAINLAGNSIRQHCRTLKEYLAHYLNERHVVAVSSDDADELEKEEAVVFANWNMTFDRIKIDRAKAAEDARILLSIFVHLHFESISREIFRAAWLSPESVNQDVPDLLKLKPIKSRPTESWGLTERRLSKAINVLHDYSIIEYDTERETCMIHPLIHKWAKTRLTAQAGTNALEQKTQGTIKAPEGDIDWLSYTVELLSRGISSHLDTSGSRFRRSILPHINFCVSILERSRSLYPKNRHEAIHLQRFALLYAESGHWKQARDLQRRVVDFCCSGLGQNHEASLEAQRILSQILWNSFKIEETIKLQGRLIQARTLSRKRLSDWFPIWPPMHLEYCIALNDITQSLWLAGELGISEYTGQRAYAGLKAKLGSIDPLTLSAMLNLARTLHHLGQLARAQQLLVAVMRKRQKFFGPNHPDTLMAENEFGMTCLASKDFVQAETVVTSVYERRQVVLGSEHAYTLWSANDLSKIYYNRVQDGVDGFPNAGRAVELLESILPIVKRTLGDDHVGMHMTKGNLARAYARSRQLDKAMAVLDEMFERIGPKHPNWSEVMTGRAEVEIKLGQLAEASRTCREVLQQMDLEEQPKLPRALRLVGPKNPVRAADLQRAKVLKLLNEVSKARSVAF